MQDKRFFWGKYTNTRSSVLSNEKVTIIFSNQINRETLKATEDNPFIDAIKKLVLTCGVWHIHGANKSLHLCHGM